MMRFSHASKTSRLRILYIFSKIVNLAESERPDEHTGLCETILEMKNGTDYCMFLLQAYFDIQNQLKIVLWV